MVTADGLGLGTLSRRVNCVHGVTSLATLDGITLPSQSAA